MINLAKKITMLSLKTQTAFTLLEVLVALSILAVGLTAAIVSSIEITRNSAYLQDKTFAHWIAENILAERQLVHITNSAQQPSTSGTVTFAKQSWEWTLIANPNPQLNSQQLTVQVTRQQQLYATLSSDEPLPSEQKA